ncbi:MAG: Amidohydrolase [Firmicutes bacterium ADurb.Bin193]|nr:MAG: Amidohydrolase [Firmicutes bacterium ADurb.Bin193]
MVIDFHTHIFPDKIAQKTIEILSRRAGLAAYTDGTLGALKRSMAEAGVDISVVLPIATKPSQANTINTYAAEITGRDGIISFGSVHPFSPDWKDELDEVYSLGLKGIKLHPDYQEFYVDDETVFPVIEYAKSLGLIIVFHSGFDIGLPEPVHCTPDRAKRLVDAVGGGNLVFAHTGGYERWDEVCEHLVGLDVYFDISFTLGKLSDKKLLEIITNHGVKKCLFATDSPWGIQKDDVEAAARLGLQKDDYNDIMYNNAARLLGLTQ